MKKKLEDTQNRRDNRGLPLEMVGIKEMLMPLIVPTKNNKIQHVTASVDFYADLPHDTKGHHMSRFVEILNRNSGKNMTFYRLLKIASEAKKELSSKNAYLAISFVYFLIKDSPITNKSGYINYNCKILSSVNSKNSEQMLAIEVPVMLLCPCSKAISRYNAHSQRSIIKVNFKLIKRLWIDDIIYLIEKEGSSEIYPVLKRPDEKHVTEKSYENPKFVEDIVRDIALALYEKKEIESFTVECESLESIHNHNAYAKYISNKAQYANS